MSVEIESPVADRLVVVYNPEIDRGDDLYLLAAINEFLWAQFGVPVDCEHIEIHLVYSPDEDGR